MMLAVCTSPSGLDIANAVLDYERYITSMNRIGKGDDSLNEVRWCTRSSQH